MRCDTEQRRREPRVSGSIADDSRGEPAAGAQGAADADATGNRVGQPKLARYARHLAGIQARQANVLIALSGAATADPDAAEIWHKNLDDRRRGMLILAADLAATGEIRPGLDQDHIADVLWLAMDVRNYDWLVRQRRWSPGQYQQWYADTVAGALLRDPSRAFDGLSGPQPGTFPRGDRSVHKRTTDWNTERNGHRRVSQRCARR